MAAFKIPRGDFRNPSPMLSNSAAKEVVDSLLSTVTEARKRFGKPTARDYEIASMPLDVLQYQLLNVQDLTVKRVVEARIRLTVEASLTTHCLTAFPYQQALDDCDEYYDLEMTDYDDIKEITDCYPLWGLVFSVKDCIHVEGFPTTLGCSSRACQKEAETADLVEKLKNAGAIMIAKTTAPQLMMSNTTHSPLWGTTRSATQVWSDCEDKEEYQVGGSSGGEAALVKMGGSQLGIGTDMGGSVRQPACLNELFGFKYTSKPDKFRWKLPEDFMTGLPHTKVPATAPGFLARDLLTLTRVVEHLDGETYLGELELDEEDYVDTDDWQLPTEPEDTGNNPRIVYTTQKSSVEVRELINSVLASMRNGDDLLRPAQIDTMRNLDLLAWAQSWTEHAKQHGFDEARAMLADDPLIRRTLFDESRLNTTASKKEEWKPDSAKLSRLRNLLLRQAMIDYDLDSATTERNREENVIFITPTYILGTPVQNSSFEKLDDAGESEIWCQIFNLLDWPAISIPFLHLPNHARRKMWRKAEDSSEREDYLLHLVEADRIIGLKGPGLPNLSLQLATLPGNHLSLLDYARRITDHRFQASLDVTTEQKRKRSESEE